MKLPSQFEPASSACSANVDQYPGRQTHWLVSKIYAILKAWNQWFRPQAEQQVEEFENDAHGAIADSSDSTSFSPTSSSSSFTASGVHVTHSGLLSRTSLSQKSQAVMTSGVGLDNFVVNSGVRATHSIDEWELACSGLDTAFSQVVASGYTRMTASGIPEAESVRTISKPRKAQPLHKIVPHARRRRLLWVGDAVVPTGFATVTHSVLKYLSRDWEVIVSGVNYDGSAHQYPYRILPAYRGGDMWGIKHFDSLCQEVSPDAVVINNDWWNVAQFARVQPPELPVIGYMPVDGGNLDGHDMAALEKLSAAVWYTNFGLNEARKAGFKGPNHIIPPWH